MDDLTEACRRTAAVLAATTDDALDAPTPCSEMPLRALVAHIGGLAQAFRAAADKEFGPLTDTPPEPDTPLSPGWRTAYPRYLAELAESWRDKAAWTGMTRAGGVDLPGEVAGSVALAEVVIHGWDVAVATGQNYDCDAATEGMFGPAVAVPDHLPAIDRIVGLSGRDPGWSPR